MTMQPKLELIPQELVDRILDEAFQLLLNPGIKVQSAEARDLLASAGAQVQDDIAHIPENLVDPHAPEAVAIETANYGFNESFSCWFLHC